ncbi:MAG: Transcriptional regulatory protein ZraR [Planctomycetota bacterium]|jgi:DNA-binding NtrC family response regulator
MPSRTRPILLVDDEALYRTSTAALLRNSGYQVTTAASAEDAMRLMREQPAGLAMVDLNLPGNEKLELLRFLREQFPDVPVMVVTGHPSLPTAIASLRLRITDYLLKPVKYEELLEAVRRVLPAPEKSSDVPASGRPLELTSRSPAMRQVLDVARRVAQTDVNILITGETGTGKEVAAREIHRLSQRGGHSFQPIDCAAIPEGLLESTLFGHARGAFTGAVGRRDGLLMQCHGGTAFLDEVGELPLMLQAKFLRTIQNESFTPVGENREIRIDTRFISATSRDLELEIAAGRFRRDLYYRLAVIHLKLPPLRERLEDLESITEDLFRQLRTPQQSAEDFSPEAWALLRRHSWPGNVRELRNVVERGLSLARGRWIEAIDLPAEIVTGGSVRDERPGAAAFPAVAGVLPMDRTAAEREYLVNLLRMSGGNVTQAAEQAGLSRQGLHRILQRHGLTAREFRGKAGGRIGEAAE